MGDIERIRSEGQITWIHKGTVQRKQGMCKSGGGGVVMVEQGLRQGCPLSPWLFNVFLDKVVREAMVRFQGGVELDSCLIQILMFADDTVMLAQTAEDLSQNVGRSMKQ